MHLGIMAQRLIVSHALNRVLDRLFIQYLTAVNGHIDAETVCNQAFQDLRLYLAH